MSSSQRSLYAFDVILPWAFGLVVRKFNGIILKSLGYEDLKACHQNEQVNCNILTSDITFQNKNRQNLFKGLLFEGNNL